MLTPEDTKLSAITRMRLRLELWRWICILAWRKANGRWYIFRDAPTHVVCEFVMSNDEDGIGQQARAEMDTRLTAIQAALSRYEAAHARGDMDYTEDFPHG